MKTEDMMPVSYWQGYLETRIAQIKSSMEAKAAEYAETEGDRMHNFNRAVDASAGRHKTREDAIFGMMLKHWVSILDMLDLIASGGLPNKEIVVEKFGDLINYSMLMEASILYKIKSYQDSLVSRATFVNPGIV